MTSPTAAERRYKVLLLAYSCSPNHGSEAKIGWNFAVGMAKYVDVWVITLDDLYGGDIRRYFADHDPIAGLHFEFVARPAWLRALRKVPGLYYVVYAIWHRLALRAARRLHARHRFDLVHQLNLCTFREPGQLWKLGVPFVWGPIGGTQNFPWRFLSEAGWSGAVREALRSVANRLQLRFSSRVGRVGQNASLVLAANSTNVRDLERSRGITARRYLETGVNSVAPELRTPRAPGELRILWSGNLAPWKGLPLLLKALSHVPANVPYHVRILGSGPDEKSYKRLARKLGVDRHITWLGWLRFAEAVEQNDWADVFVFTSLRDTSGNVVLEALAAGVPVVCLDHQGAADIVKDTCGIKIPVTRPHRVIRELAEAIRLLAEERELRRELSRGALDRAADYLWPCRIEYFASVYREILEPANHLAPVAGLQRRPA